MKEKKCILLIVLFLMQISLYSQQSDSTAVAAKDIPKDTLIAIDKAPTATIEFGAAKKRSATIAGISSAIVPGLGQVYNGAYWKIPVIYGIGAAIYYYYDQYDYLYKRFKKAEYEVNNDLTISDPQMAKFSKEDITIRKDDYYNKLSYQVVYLGLLYIANIIDAMVDSYLVEYDVSKDLSLKLRPTFLPPDPYSYAASCGIKFSLKF